MGKEKDRVVERFGLLSDQDELLYLTVDGGERLCLINCGLIYAIAEQVPILAGGDYYFYYKARVKGRFVSGDVSGFSVSEMSVDVTGNGGFQTIDIGHEMIEKGRGRRLGAFLHKPRKLKDWMDE
ncbi:hypothetical protein [Pseudomonas indica]|uniref:hypothetical protein n=1 Tax=Pseudomonas indica TaxID=137658 RepID=UPI00111401C0|nr:hypothetical protein [Pseudomonas indica]